MWDILQAIFDPAYMPHGQCYLWQPGVLWTNVISDALIFIAYGLIPVAIGIVLWKRPNLLLPKIATLFICFIAFCGITHLVGVWNVWHGAYWLAGLMKALTAIASIATAITLFVILPRILRIPTSEDLAEEVLQRDLAVRELESERARLQENIEVRTAAIYAKNRELIEEKKRLEAFQDMALEREERMVELKREINELLSALGRPLRFPPAGGESA